VILDMPMRGRRSRRREVSLKGAVNAGRLNLLLE
jgi:hypothetical protein